MVPGWINQIELLASFVLCDIFPLLAGIFYRWTFGADETQTVVCRTNQTSLSIYNIYIYISVVNKIRTKFIQSIFLLLFFFSSLVGIQKRISQGLDVLQYYTTKNWTFRNEKFLRMKEKMSAKDQEMFYFSVEDVSDNSLHRQASKQKNKQMQNSDFVCKRPFFLFSRLIGTHILDTISLVHDTFYSKKSQRLCLKHAFCFDAFTYSTNWFQFYFMV